MPAGEPGCLTTIHRNVTSFLYLPLTAIVNSDKTLTLLPFPLPLPTRDKRREKNNKMNLNLKENRFYLQALKGIGLFIGLLIVSWIVFRAPNDNVDAPRNASSTRTAIALTAGALMGPFPTATGPTPTASKTPTITPTFTSTPTSTLSPTPFRYFISTATPRTAVPRSNTAFPSIASSTVFAATHTPIPPIQPTNTSAPPAQPTDPPPTLIPPTDPPPTPVQPTDPPPLPVQATPCLNPQGHPIPCH